jgi:phosphoribosylaminoimidazolecarboxamide formyltransferase/IMP cyclohydrolase
VSVSEKTNLRELCDGLVALGIELYATSSTRAAIESYGLPVKSVESATGFPEILGGRVKTLHPVVFGGILARQGNVSDEADLQKHGLFAFDIVVCNLYPFQDTLEKLGAACVSPESIATLVEKVDVGGVTLLRAAAKNFERVSILCDSLDYLPFLDEVRASSGRTSVALRARLAVKALRETASYDTVISETLATLLEKAGAYESRESLAAGFTDGPVRSKGGHFSARTVSKVEGIVAELPQALRLEFRKVQDLRYGENPHQRAAFYSAAERAHDSSEIALPGLHCFHGKELSYNNVLDVEHAVRLVSECHFQLGASLVAVIVKHNVPCGVGVSMGPEASLALSYQRAFESDPVSPFGGIVAFSSTVDEEAARALSETFLEVVVAPDFSPAATEWLQRKKNLRLVKLDTRLPLANRWQFTHVQGGLLVQETDALLWDAKAFRAVTTKPLPVGSEGTLKLAFSVVKHVRSNAIVLARDNQTIAIAGGFTNRVDAVRQVLEKARIPLDGAVLASDAFFPFPDSVELLKGKGLAAIVQPGGSVQDAAVIAACNAQGLAMAFTGMRHFKH